MGIDYVLPTSPIMQPLLDAPPPVQGYQQGTWAPETADALVADFGGWRDPWVRS